MAVKGGDKEHKQDCLCYLRSSNGKVGGFPGGEAAGDFGDFCEAGALEEAGGDRGAIAASAVDEDFAVVWQFCGFFN